MLGAWQVKYIISSFKVYFVILYKYLRQEKFSNDVRGSANAVYIVHGGYRLLPTECNFRSTKELVSNSGRSMADRIMMTTS